VLGREAIVGVAIAGAGQRVEVQRPVDFRAGAQNRVHLVVLPGQAVLDTQRVVLAHQPNNNNHKDDAGDHDLYNGESVMRRATNRDVPCILQALDETPMGPAAQGDLPTVLSSFCAVGCPSFRVTQGGFCVLLHAYASLYKTPELGAPEPVLLSSSYFRCCS